MDFIVALLNFIGVLFYFAVAVCALGLFIGFSDASNGEKYGARIGIIALVAGVAFAFSGYYIRKGADSIRRNFSFEQSLNKGEKNNVIRQFRPLSEKKKNKYIKEIYDTFYGDSLSEMISFIGDFKEETIPFILQKKDSVSKIIENLYLEAESINSAESWIYFSSQVSGKAFLNLTSFSLQDREFRKWTSDEDAWERVLLMDSIVMAEEYLSRFENGNHVEDAKRIILNYTYDSYTHEKPPYRITSNYNGTTTLSIQNSSSVDIVVTFWGTFAEGQVKVFKYGYATTTVPNGYYRISASTNQRRARGESSLETFSGGVVSKNYILTQAY